MTAKAGDVLFIPAGTITRRRTSAATTRRSSTRYESNREGRASLQSMTRALRSRLSDRGFWNFCAGF